MYANTTVAFDIDVGGRGQWKKIKVISFGIHSSSSVPSVISLFPRVPLCPSPNIFHFKPHCKHECLTLRKKIGSGVVCRLTSDCNKTNFRSFTGWYYDCKKCFQVSLNVSNLFHHVLHFLIRKPCCPYVLGIRCWFWVCFSIISTFIRYCSLPDESGNYLSSLARKLNSL